MSNGSTASYTIQPQDYKKAVAAENDFYIQFNVLSPAVDGIINKCVHRYLAHYDLGYIKNQIINVIKELVNNAIKANLKRLYFTVKKLDINKTEDYRQGMETFKEETYEGDEDYMSMLADSPLVVRVAFKTSGEYLYINVINNVPILDTELSKINARIKKAYKYNDISEAFDEVLDDSEGAGLGLIMAMMIFKNMGMSPESFRIYRKKDLTISAIAIPLAMDKIRARVQIAGEIIREIESIPAFPDNIIRIQKLCANPDATIKEIAGAISLDPGLTTSILKLANSAGYFTVKKTETIEEAVKIIGVKGINALLLATGVHKVMDARYKRSESTWKDSYKRAAYASQLAVQMKKTKLGDFAYLAALLSDVGFIVMLSLRSELLKSLQELAGFKGMENIDLLEEISLGISHAALGGMIFSKWKFNDALIKTVEYHHRPHMAPVNIRQLVFIVYLADCLVEIDKNRFRYEFIDEDVIEYFNLGDRKAFDIMHKVLKESYENQQKEL
ncbi:MAG: HDOD domain-containing protein [Spirochaetes bacterium]|nr:HDOD domain-containing protein [Spirochaetota bacterium]HOD14011.1 HDOD domain-containing protein [Spirochaetota bacterium]